MNQIDSLNIVERIDSLSAKLGQIIENTDAFNDGFSTIFTYSSLAASIVTVLGVTAVFIRISKRSISNSRQKKIVLDLLRHMMVNNAILDLVYEKYESNSENIPIEGTLERFATLDDDMNLCKFSLRAKNYEKLHNVSLQIRNYNSAVCNADKHLRTEGYDKDIMKEEFKGIFRRSLAISEKLLALSKEMHWFPVTMDCFAKYATAKYPTSDVSDEPKADDSQKKKAKDIVISSYIDRMNDCESAVRECRQMYEDYDLADVYKALVNSQRGLLVFEGEGKRSIK